MTPGFHAPDDVQAVKCELAGEVLHSCGTLRLRVMGWSMLPAVWPGDTLFVESASTAAVTEGDIILFAKERRFFVHRIVKRLEQSNFLSRGDAMRKPDPVVHSEELLGKVCSIVRNGKRLAVRRNRGVFERATAGLVAHSPLAARLLVRVGRRRRGSSFSASKNQEACCLS
jgi:signal peptidase I